MIYSTLIKVIIQEELAGKSQLYLCKFSDLKTLGKILDQPTNRRTVHNPYKADSITTSLLIGGGILKTIKYTTFTKKGEFLLGVLKTGRLDHACIRVRSIGGSYDNADVVLSSKDKFASGIVAEGLDHQSQMFTQYYIASLNSNPLFTFKERLTEDHYNVGHLSLRNVVYEALLNSKFKLWMQGHEEPTHLECEHPLAQEYLQNTARACGLSVSDIATGVLHNYKDIAAECMQNKKALVDAYTTDFALTLLKKN